MQYDNNAGLMFRSLVKSVNYQFCYKILFNCLIGFVLVIDQIEEKMNTYQHATWLGQDSQRDRTSNHHL